MSIYRMSAREDVAATKGRRAKPGQRRRAVLVATTALSLLAQNAAWATCSIPAADGSTSLPSGGFVVGSAQVPVAANWSPNVFTGTAGSLYIPDTAGGHNWVFDQGSTLCKVGNQTDASGSTIGWTIPPNTPTDCVVLPIIKGGRITNIGDIPYQGQVVTPTCNPAILASASNTYFNQLGCSISHGVATDAAHATSWLFVAGIKGGLFSVKLDNSATPGVGKTAGPQDYYSAIPEGQKLVNGAV